MSEFKYIEFKGSKLSPEQFGGREPNVDELSGLVSTSEQVMVNVKLFDGVHWLLKRTYEFARNVLDKTSDYEAHEGVTFTASKGVWLIIGDPKPVEPPIGATKKEKYVIVETKISREIGLEPLIIEERFVFKGFKGEDIERGRITKYRYFIAAYRRNGESLTESELKETLLWKNYLSKSAIVKVLKSVSKTLKREFWHLERMGKHAMKQYKVVWRDVAKEFIPAVETTGSIPDHTVNYVAVDNLEEAYYLLAVLLAPQINAVVKEWSPWIGHVKPRFIKYFKIPKYSQTNDIAKQLAQIGNVIHSTGELTLENLKKIEELVEKL
jgi:hypothetical protein